jgi:hypothetical protein
MLLEDICYRLFDHKSSQVKVEINRRFGALDESVYRAENIS